MSILQKKLQLKDGQKMRLVNVPKGLALDLPAGKAAGDAILVFAKNRAELEKHAQPAVDAAAEDLLAWVAYPKDGLLDSDLSRDNVAALMHERGVQAVRQVAIDDVWSALRFRPA